MSDEHGELIKRAADALAEIDIAADRARAAVASTVEHETGMKIAFGKPSVMDAGFRDLVRMRIQVDHYIAGHDLIKQWMLPTDTRTLGQLMPQLPEEIRELVAEHLAEAGLS